MPDFICFHPLCPYPVSFVQNYAIFPYVLCSFLCFYMPYMPYARLRHLRRSSRSLLLLFCSCVLYFISRILYDPCDPCRLLRLTGDSQYLSRGEMMSTRALQPRKSTKTTFPRPSLRSHDTPTHRTSRHLALPRSPDWLSLADARKIADPNNRFRSFGWTEIT